MYPYNTERILRDSCGYVLFVTSGVAYTGSLGFHCFSYIKYVIDMTAHEQ